MTVFRYNGYDVTTSGQGRQVKIALFSQSLKPITQHSLKGQISDILHDADALVVKRTGLFYNQLEE